MEQTEQQNHSNNHAIQVHQQHQARYDRAYTYMKRPEFLLLLGLVNLLFLICISSRLHRMMHFDNMGYGGKSNHMQMMQRGQGMMRGNQGYYPTRMMQGRTMVNPQVQYQEQAQDMPANVQTQSSQPVETIMVSPK